jgi:hypothetical protein
LAPRVGLAYRVDSRTVVRASYGISQDITGYNGDYLFALPEPSIYLGQNIINSATVPRNRL